jgi:hypothetical protein
MVRSATKRVRGSSTQSTYIVSKPRVLTSQALDQTASAKLALRNMAEVAGVRLERDDSNLVFCVLVVDFVHSMVGVSVVDKSKRELIQLAS